MYRGCLRPLLFLFPPEWVHRVVARLLGPLAAIPLMSALIRKLYAVEDPRLEREVFGIRFPNPVGIAAGFDKEARLYNSLKLFGFGHVELGTVTPRGQKGNPRPRLFRLPKDKALVNRMGFNNDGVKAFARQLRKRAPQLIIGGNIGKNTLTPNNEALHDYLECFRELFSLVDYFVINVSCPNIKDMSQLQEKPELLKILGAIQGENKARPAPKPVLLKISPDLDEARLDEVLDIVREARLDGIVATNTSSLREGLSTESVRVEKVGRGGLSGQPLRQKSLRTIAYLHKRSEGKVPIIGVGGIMSAQDAVDTLAAGASLVQMYTGFVYQGPSLAKRINRALLEQLTDEEE